MAKTIRQTLSDQQKKDKEFIGQPKWPDPYTLPVFRVTINNTKEHGFMHFTSRTTVRAGVYDEETALSAPTIHYDSVDDLVLDGWRVN